MVTCTTSNNGEIRAGSGESHMYPMLALSRFMFMLTLTLMLMLHTYAVLPLSDVCSSCGPAGTPCEGHWRAM